MDKKDVPTIINLLYVMLFSIFNLKKIFVIPFIIILVLIYQKKLSLDITPEITTEDKLSLFSVFSIVFALFISFVRIIGKNSIPTGTIIRKRFEYFIYMVVGIVLLIITFIILKIKLTDIRDILKENYLISLFILLPFLCIINTCNLFTNNYKCKNIKNLNQTFKCS